MLKRNNNAPNNMPSKAGLSRTNRGYSRLEKINISILCVLIAILSIQLMPYIMYLMTTYGHK